MLSNTDVMSHNVREQQAELYCLLQSKNIQIWIELFLWHSWIQYFPFIWSEWHFGYCRILLPEIISCHKMTLRWGI